jgi:hypothetical protein
MDTDIDAGIDADIETDMDMDMATAWHGYGCRYGPGHVHWPTNPQAMHVIRSSTLIYSIFSLQSLA